jgi:hypothetical protein
MEQIPGTENIYLAKQDNSYGTPEGLLPGIHEHAE